MTTREAVRVLRALTGRGGYVEEWNNVLPVREAIGILIRALTRPTRLEREAAVWISEKCGVAENCKCGGCRWLARYERKAKR